MFKDVAGFSRLAEQIRALPGVQGVNANPLVGSVRVLYEGPLEALVRSAHDQQVFRLTAAPPSPKLTAQLAQGLAQTNRNLEAVSGGKVDFDGFLVVGLSGLAIHQAIQGNIMAPAVSLIWYALNTVRKQAQSGSDRGVD